MTIHWLDYAIIILYFFVVVYIGYWAMKKVTNFDDYAVAGRGLPMSIFFAAIAATLCGGGATIGRVSFMHTTGIVVFAGLIGVVINQIFSGLYIAGRVHNIKNVYSVGDLFGLYYGRAGRLVSSIVCFFFCLGLYGVQILAMGAILQTAVGIDLIPAALISSVITLAYTWSGGMLAVTMTDAVQYVIIIIGVSLCGYLAIDHLGGFDAMMATLNAMPRYESNLKLFSGWGPIQFAGLFLSFLFGEFCAPYFIQRYASTKSAKDSKAGVLIFSVHWIFFLATTAGIGLASMALQPDVKPDLAFTNLIRDVLPIGVTGLVLAALLAAVMSS
ncbi:MAG: sodium:solute symporter family protein, partial [Bilophila sp.]|nr:sodium:solute symporter family protein [Bilophila sp.]